MPVVLKKIRKRPFMRRHVFTRIVVSLVFRGRGVFLSLPEAQSASRVQFRPNPHRQALLAAVLSVCRASGLRCP